MELENWVSGTVSIGEKFGRLTVLSTHKIIGTYRYLAKCQCDCESKPIYVRIDALRIKHGSPRKATESCGCLQKEAVTTHGAWGKPGFRSWSAMMQRCYNESDSHYYLYGGRGIEVCDYWHDVNNFLKDMAEGFKPFLTIERTDNNKGYYKENCRWIPREDQARNKRTNINLTYQGKTMCIAEWARFLHMDKTTLRERIRDRDWSVEKALSTPARTGNYKRKT